jgi:hypothetical protein
VPIGGPGPIGGQRLAEKERERKVFNQIFKIEIGIKIKVFFRKTF